MSSKKSIKWSNPVVETYRGHEIRKYPMLRIRLTVPEMKKSIDLKMDKGLTGRDVVKKGLLLCPCTDTGIIKSTYGKGY